MGTEQVADGMGQGVWAVVGILVVLLVAAVVMFARLRKRLVDGRKYYPTGEPDEDCERLEEWWATEMRYAGVPGDISVEYEPCEDDSERWNRAKAVWEAIAGGTTQLEEAHSYHAVIPCEPYEIETAVITTDEGVITRVIYSGFIGGTFDGEVTFKKENDVPFILDKFEGAGAEELNRDKELRKVMGRSMSFSYEIPRSVLSVTEDSVDVSPAICTITPADNGAEVVFSSSLRTSTIGVYQMTLGLKNILAALDALTRKIR